ncbi:Nuclease-related domain-containing protein [Aromatoleum tolulyticum]|uniref:Nuclease-related domain-containing protein n=1 Tax=Aromatoleum tolulyticum TaxID=34027 RepID=A0A1N6NU43_9RHOO|nr:ATP-binding domain-containing protein [Aromatoleum tolulyticum]SIP95609.1 Nuclease-related domain-containing protein [Aromatoleum tolulyticum]
MARIHPEGWQRIPASGALARELETLATLAEGLPDDHAVYHGIHWTRVNRDHALFGEIDFVVVGPTGRVLLIEQKSGFLDETQDGLVKTYAKARKNVSVQMARSADHLRERLGVFLKGHKARIDALLYCPDYAVRQPGSAGIDPARIVDASRRQHLVAIVESLLRDDVRDRVVLDNIHRFLTDELELVPEVNAIVGQAEALYTRLAGGLAEWARRIEMEPFRLRVTGTAGSGKTQLAMAVFRDALAAGRRPLYVCYNRPLADHIALIAPPGGEIATYHQLCDRVLRAHGEVPDFRRPDAFAQLETRFRELDPGEAWRFDELIVDEGQDFRAEWLDTLLRLLRPGGRAWWLEDPLQNLYDRPPVELPGWVRITSERNYRSPGDILSALNRMLPLPQALEAGSPLTGSDVEFLTWSDSAGLIDATKRAMTRAIGLGFRRDMIATITFRGREHSVFTPFDRLGAHRLKAFTGSYDLLGNPVYSDGDFLIDSVYRFKGQAAPCVIFTEIDFEELDPLTVRKLFVGATRAGMKLIMVLSEHAAARLVTGLED